MYDGCVMHWVLRLRDGEAKIPSPDVDFTMRLIETGENGMITDTEDEPLAKLDAMLIFPKLPSFHTIALVFSFFNYQQRVACLMAMLSKKTKDYFRGHKEILDSFLVKWNPIFTRVIVFGGQS